MTARDRRALVRGAGIIGAALLLLRLVPWGAGQLTQIREDAGAASERLVRLRQDIQDTPALEDSGTVIRGRLAGLASRILSGRRELDARADLGARLEAAVSRNTLRLIRTEPRTDSAAAGGLRRVSLEASLQGDNAGVTGLLAALAENSAALVVQQIRVVATNPRTPRSAAEVLDVDLVVRGWYLGRERP